MDPLMQLTGFVVLHQNERGQWYILNNQVYPTRDDAEREARKLSLRLWNVNAVNVWVHRPVIVQPPTG